MDPSSDVALLDVEDDNDLTPLEMGDSGEVEVGDPVVAIGNPFGLDRTVTSGIVSAKARQIQAPNGFSISDVLQTDAAVNPGNSGGPLLDGQRPRDRHQLPDRRQGGGNEGVAFAVPIETAQEVADQLLADGSVERAYLGISGGDMTSEAAEALDLQTDNGVLVDRAYEGGPADKAGIRAPPARPRSTASRCPPAATSSPSSTASRSRHGGDHLGRQRRPARRRAALTVVRDGESREVTVTLGDRPEQIADAAGAAQPASRPARPRARGIPPARGRRLREQHLHVADAALAEAGLAHRQPQGPEAAERLVVAELGGEVGVGDEALAPVLAASRRSGR